MLLNMDFQPKWKSEIVMKGQQDFIVNLDTMALSQKMRCTDLLMTIWKLVAVQKHQALIQPHKGPLQMM